MLIEFWFDFNFLLVQLEWVRKKNNIKIRVREEAEMPQLESIARVRGNLPLSIFIVKKIHWTNDIRIYSHLFLLCLCHVRDERNNYAGRRNPLRKRESSNKLTPISWTFFSGRMNFYRVVGIEWRNEGAYTLISTLVSTQTFTLMNIPMYYNRRYMNQPIFQ